MLLGFAGADAPELEKAANETTSNSRNARETVRGVPL